MSGIAGAVGLPMDQVKRAVMAMMQAMIHRGPDNEGFEECGSSEQVGGCCGLGHRGLSTTDLEDASRQPIINPLTGDVLAFDGFLSGFQSLRFRLESLGYVFRGIGDTEVLLYALQEWGVKAFDQIDGMYAVAWYERRSHRLLLARDPLGIKPLYVARTDESLAFASEVRAILASGLVDDELDPAGIASFLAYGAPQDPLTVHRQIKSFQPGTFEWFDCGGQDFQPARPVRFWHFPTLADPLEPDQIVEDIHFEISKQIRDHCVAEVTECVFSSGGVYSSAVAAFAKVLTGPVQNFHFVYQPGADEREAARAAKVSHMIGAKHFQAVADDEWFLQQWDQWARSSDRPSVSGLPIFMISGAANDAGVVVSLAGIGGSQLFCEQNAFRGMARLARWDERLAGMPAWLRRGVRRVATGVLGSGLDLGVSTAFHKGFGPVEFALASRRIASDETLSRFGCDWQNLGLNASYVPPSAFDAMQPGRNDAFHQIMAVECLSHLGNTAIRDADVYGLANSLEIRLPLLSRSVVNALGSLPRSIKLPAGRPPRFLLGSVLSGIIPKSILNLHDRNYSLPYAKWMKGPLMERSEAAIDSVCDKAPLDPIAVREVWQRRVERGGSQNRLALVCLGNYLSSVSRQRRPARNS